MTHEMVLILIGGAIGIVVGCSVYALSVIVIYKWKYRRWYAKNIGKY